ncbi:NAD(P)H-dependent oxidoreductase [Sphingomonas sp. Root710]|uniref:NAD(P)H-dependent oxidoreductase n=1 Tax=Sphingomonas sp. Root710 TaxID=1736594 RepID=UPI000AB15DD4|nr:NAD(P)H-dependent oxidoreductase [Sphingomonas sp. Root710]
MSSIDRPVRHAVILAHPDAHSFNAAIAQTYCDTVRDQGQEFVLRDLYRMGFDPVLREEEQPGAPGFHVSADVRAELEALEGSDIFTFIYPIWFGMPPAILKGYIDRVVGSGVTVSQIRKRHGQGLLSAAHLLCITTSGAPEAWLNEQGQVQALREISTRYLFRAFAMKSARTMHIGGIVEGLGKLFADRHLNDVREEARAVCARLYAERRGMAPLQTIGDGS